MVEEQGRWVLWLPVLLGVGIATYFTLPAEPPLLLGPAVFSLAAGFAWLGRHNGVLVLSAVALAVSALGFSVVQWRTALLAAPVLEERIGPTRVTGRIASLEIRAKDSRAVLETPRIAGIAAPDTPEKVRVTLRGKQPELHVGDWIRLRAVLTPPPPPSTPGAFDFQRQSWYRQIGGVGYALGPARVDRRAETRGIEGLLLDLADLRHAIGLRVLAALEGQPGAVATALMTGEKGAVPEALMEDLRDSGLAHLLAISGLHIGLVAGILFFGLRAGLALVPGLALHYPIKKWAAGGAIVGAFVYALLAGATVPTLRAFLMIGLVLLAVMVDRRGLSMRLVAWAATVLLLVAPESLLGASFQLSFAAVTALIAVYEALKGRMPSRFGEDGGGGLARKIAFYLAGVALTTLVASSATAPFAVYHFNRFAAFGLAANLVAVPVTALWIMPWAVLAFLLMPLGLEHLALVPAAWGIEVVAAVAGTVAGWPGAVSVIPSMPPWGLGCIVLGGLWLALWQKRWRLFGGAGLAAGLVSLMAVTPPDLLVDGRGRLVALRVDKQTLAVSSLRTARFERDVWLRRSGAEEAVPWRDENLSTLHCDAEGCLFTKGDRTISVAHTPGALIEDCWDADALVSLVPVRRRCPVPGVVIDRFDLWRDGAHALWVNENGVRAESVNNSRGDRPWVLRPAAAKRKAGT